MTDCSSLYVLSTLACRLAECLSEDELGMLGIPLHESSVLVYSHMGAAFAAKQDSPSLAAVRVVVEIGKIGFPDYELFFGGGN